MTSIRPFDRNDIAGVAELYADVFLHDQQTEKEDIKSYIETVYLEHPFRDDRCPSLVYCNKKGEIAGFMGVVTRQMHYAGETIKVAMLSNLMIKGEKRKRGQTDLGKAEAHHNQLAPLAMTKTLLKSEADLFLTDTANEPSRKILELIGGHTLRLYSFKWIRAIRPLGFGLNLLDRMGHYTVLSRLGKPVSSVLDSAGSLMMSLKRSSPPNGCSLEPLSSNEMLDTLANDRRYQFKPIYSHQCLNWMLDLGQAEENRRENRALAVRNLKGDLIGWFVYQQNRHDVSYVLRFHAQSCAFEQVFDCLIWDATKGNTLALIGKADPLFIERYPKKLAMLRISGWTMAYTRREELLQPFYLGKALFSDLESEGWMRLARFF